MTFRPDIIAGKAVILVGIQDTVDKQLRTIRAKIRRFSNSLTEIGGDLFRFGTVSTIGSLLPIKEFVTFQDSVLFLQSKLRDTGVDTVALEKQIRDLGKSTSFTSTQVAEAAAVLAQAGLGAGVGPTLLPTLDLARGARVELDVAGRILANILSAFNLPFDKADEVASKLTTAARLGTTDIVLLGEGLKESLTTFRQLNVPFESAISLITALSNVSLRGTKAGTSLNTAFANLASKLPELEELGIFIDPKDFQDPIVIFEKLQASLSNLQPTEQVRELQRLFNIRGARGFGGIIVNDLEKLRSILDQVKNSTGEAREAAELLDSRLGGVFRRALSAFQELNLSVGATTEGPLTKLGAALQGIFNDLSLLSQENPKVVQTLLLIPPVALGAGVALLSFGFALNKVASAITPLVSLNRILFDSLARLASINIVAFGKVGSALSSIGKGVTGPSFLTKTRSLFPTPAEFGELQRRQLAALRTAQQRPQLLIANPRAAERRREIIRRQIEQERKEILKARNTARLKLQQTLPTFGGRGELLSLQGRLAAEQASGSTTLSKGERARITARIAALQKEEAAVASARAKIIAKGDASIQKQIAKIDDDAAKKMVALKKKEARALVEADKFTTKQRKSVLKAAAAEQLKVEQGRLKQIAALEKLEGRNRSLSLAKGGGFTKFFVGLKRGLTSSAGALRLFEKGFDFIRSTNFLRKFIDLFVGLGNTLRSVFFIINNIRRAVFSLSGILTIAEFIFLFGSEIPIVKAGLEAIGNVIKQVGRDTLQVIKNTKPAFTSLGIGFSRLFSGDLVGALAAFKVGIKDLAAIISTGLADVWERFLEATEGARERILAVFRGVLNTVTAIFEVIKGIVGVTSSNIGLGSGSLPNQKEGLSNFFSTANIDAFFAGLVGLVVEIGKRFITLADIVTKVGNLIVTAIGRLLEVLRVINPKAGVRKDLDPAVAAEGLRRLAGVNLSEKILGVRIASGTISNEEALRQQNVLAENRRKLEKLLYGESLPQFAFSADDARAALDRFTNSLTGTSLSPRNTGATGTAAAGAVSTAATNAANLLFQDALPLLPGIIGEPVKKAFGALGQGFLNIPKNILDKAKSPFSDKGITKDELGVIKGIGTFNAIADFVQGAWTDAAAKVAVETIAITQARIDETGFQLISSLVGDFASTRNNKVFLDKSIEKDQLSVLQDIRENTKKAADNAGLFQ